MFKLLNTPLEVATDHYLIQIQSESTKPEPGQFINIRFNNTLTDPLLRRPFSIYNYENNIMDIIFRVAGKTTALMRDSLQPGIIDILGPLGNGWTINKDKKVLLIGGGVGNAPLYYLARELKNNNCQVDCIYGARSLNYIYGKKDFENVCDNFIITTDDGSCGLKCLVVDPLIKLLMENNYDYIYTCGPTPMMKGVVNILKDYSIPVEVSLENYFGCGIGICSGCSVTTSNGLKKACVDGPVFDGRIIDWNTL